MERLDFKLLSTNTAKGLADLAVHRDEAHLIAPNPDWIIQAHYQDEALTYGAYRGSQPVAMISLLDPRLANEDDQRDSLQPGCLYVWRLMVDGRFRRQGIARQMIDFAQGYGELIGLRGLSLTTMDTAKGNALPLYTKLGFTPTGRRIHGEIELARR